MTAGAGRDSVTSMRPLPALAAVSAVLVCAAGLWVAVSGGGTGAQEALAPAAGAAAGAGDGTSDLADAAPETSRPTGARVDHSQPGATPLVGALDVQCLESLTVTPVPGVRVRFLAEGQPLAAGRSDEQGRLAVVLEAPADEVLVEPPPGWWCVRHGSKAGGYEVRLASSNRGPLRATLIDAATAEPIPEYVLVVRDGEGWSETLQSDAHGLLVGRTLFGPTTLALITAPEEFGASWVRPYRLALHEHRPQGATPPTARIAITVGPTYQLALDNPGEVPLADLRAYLTFEAWKHEVVDNRARAHAVRPGEAPWVRFPRSHRWSDPPYLVVADTGKRWVGHVRVESWEGRHEGLLPVKLERVVRVRGHVVDAEGNNVSRAQVELQPVGASGAAPRRGTSNGPGNFFIDAVTPGSYELLVRHTTAGRARLRIEVDPANEELIDVVLEPFAFAGDISGVVRSLSGEFEGTLNLVLVPTEDADEDLAVRRIGLRWEEENGERLGRFRFETVADGTYELHATVRGRSYEVLPEIQALTPPREGLELVVRDDVERRQLHFLAVDEETADYLEGAHLRLVDSTGAIVFDGDPGELRELPRFAEGEAFEWKLEVEGYVPLSGDRRAFEELAGGSSMFAVIGMKRD